MALKFNGTSDYVGLGQPPAILTLSAITYSGWVYMNTVPSGYRGFIVKTGGVQYCSFYIINGKLSCYLDAQGADVHIDPGTNTLSPNTWYHLAATYSASTGLILYINGSQDSTFAANGKLLTIASASDFLFGNDSGSAGRFFAGTISDCSVYSTALPASDILRLASGISPLAVSPGTLVGYWPLAGTRLQGFSRDLGPNGILATPFGCTADSNPPGLIPYPDFVLSPIFAEGEMPALFTAAAPPAAKGSTLPLMGVA